MDAELVDGFEPVSLKELDERAALLRRVDNKYAVEEERFRELLERIRDDHQVLDIDGRRLFGYRSTYFDSPELRCYVDHVEGHAPRFKARTRLYVDSATCVFEVKLKREDGETDKQERGRRERGRPRTRRTRARADVAQQVPGGDQPGRGRGRWVAARERAVCA